MATRLKTVEYWFPHLATAADNTDTNFTQITLYLPEGSKSFKSVVFDVTYHDANTTLTGTSARRQVSIQLASAGYSTVNNTNTYTLSGENYVAEASGDFTSYFNTNWSGTSMTCDGRFLYDMSTASPLGARNLSGRLTITYEYDDTTTTHVKTIRIPLDAPVGALGTTKPSATATIPDLSSYLPEDSVTIRQTCFVVQGNTNTTATTDQSFTYQVDTDTAFTTQNYEQGGTQAMFFRFNELGAFTTNASHSWYLWGSLAVGHHLQAWLVVTYEFDSTTTTTVLNSLLLPMEMASPMGGTTSSDYQRGTRQLMIEEPTTITTLEVAYYLFFDSQTVIGGLNCRVGTGSFVTYTDNASILAGSNALMCRNDSAFTLTRGRNNLSFDVYRTDATDLGFNISGFWIVNYTSGIATDGVGAHNHSVIFNLKTYGTTATAVDFTTSAIAPAIPETNYFITAIGTRYHFISNTTGQPAGVNVLFEKTSGEGGVQWLDAYADIGTSDPETGIRCCFSQIRDYFKRWNGDCDPSRLDIETARRWRIVQANACSGFHHLDLLFTYHTITFEVSGTISNSNGGTVNLSLIRDQSGELTEKLLTTSRSGNGTYTFTWYDDTEDVFVEAFEDSSHLGRSDSGVAT